MLCWLSSGSARDSVHPYGRYRSFSWDPLWRQLAFLLALSETFFYFLWILDLSRDGIKFDLFSKESEREGPLTFDMEHVKPIFSLCRIPFIIIQTSSSVLGILNLIAYSFLAVSFPSLWTEFDTLCIPMNLISRHSVDDCIAQQRKVLFDACVINESRSVHFPFQREVNENCSQQDCIYACCHFACKTVCPLALINVFKTWVEKKMKWKAYQRENKQI